MDGKEALCTGLGTEASSVGSGCLQQSNGCGVHQTGLFLHGRMVALCLCTEIKPQNPSKDGQDKGLSRLPALAEALLAIDGCQERESQCFSGMQPLKDCPCFWRWFCTMLMMGTPSGLGGFKQTNKQTRTKTNSST